MASILWPASWVARLLTSDPRPLASALSLIHSYLHGVLSSPFFAAIHRRNLRKPSWGYFPKVYGKVCSLVCARYIALVCAALSLHRPFLTGDPHPALCHTSSLMLYVSLEYISLDPHILLQLILKFRQPGELPFYQDDKGSLC